MFKTAFSILSKCHRSSVGKRKFSRNQLTADKVYASLAMFGLTTIFVLANYKNWKQRDRKDEQVELCSCDEAVDQPDVKYDIESRLCKADPDNARNKYNFIDKVVKRCAPAVFHILITSNKTDPSSESSPFVYGSGFVIREDGWAITNAHVVLNRDSLITCRMSDGTLHDADVVDIDVNVDVALLRLRTGDRRLSALAFEEPGVVSVGEWVVALGSPLSLSNSISVGVVSSVDRSARELGLKNYAMSYIQTDALITFGNSGGPLVNLDGKVIGISSLRLTSGISFAIPVGYCLSFLQNCRAFNPDAPRATAAATDMTLFGLTTIALTPKLAIDLLRKQIAVPDNVAGGLLVWKVLDDSVAKRCGIRAGDIITHINGVPVKRADEMYKIARAEALEFVVIDGKTQRELTIPISFDKTDPPIEDKK